MQAWLHGTWDPAPYQTKHGEYGRPHANQAPYEPRVARFWRPEGVPLNPTERSDLLQLSFELASRVNIIFTFFDGEDPDKYGVPDARHLISAGFTGPSDDRRSIQVKLNVSGIKPLFLLSSNTPDERARRYLVHFNAAITVGWHSSMCYLENLQLFC
jgi:hypothetical protein